VTRSVSSKPVVRLTTAFRAWVSSSRRDDGVVEDVVLGIGDGPGRRGHTGEEARAITVNTTCKMSASDSPRPRSATISASITSCGSAVMRSAKSIAAMSAGSRPAWCRSVAMRRSVSSSKNLSRRTLACAAAQ
jgi:hypothetical protein